MVKQQQFQLLVHRTHPEARLPERAHPGDLGYDLATVTDATVVPGQRALLPTGLVCHFPDGWGGLLRDRSSMAIAGIHVLAGVIDSGYRGEIKVLLVNLGAEPVNITVGSRIAQMIPCPVQHWEVVERFEADLATKRGTGGFGSSGV